MNFIQRIEHYQKMWHLILPHIPIPPSEDAARWGLYSTPAVEAAIIRTSKRFSRTKITPDFLPVQAYRYATATARAIAQPDSRKDSTMTNHTNTKEAAVANLEAAQAAAPNHYRDLAEHLIASGEVNEQTTIADAKAMLDRHNSVRP